MGDLRWPATIKPLTNKNYSTERGGNVFSTAVGGGLPRQALDNSIDSPEFRLNFILSDLAYQVALNFYDAAINHGADSFIMQLNSGNGIEDHQVYIKPGTWRVSRPVDGTWYLGFTVTAESTSSQFDACTNLYDLYSCYGCQTGAVIDGLEDFVLGSPNAY